MCMYVCVCVCVRERESAYVIESERQNTTPRLAVHHALQESHPTHLEDCGSTG